MSRLLRVALVVPAVTGGVMWVRPVWIISGLALVAAAALWWFARCHHPRPLGLVPPLTDEFGERQPARWFCGKCGRYFPADFDHVQTPVQRFSGYDESKARAAAKRAADLADRQRELAVKRAGMGKRAPADRPAPSRPVPARPEPVPIHERRLAG